MTLGEGIFASTVLVITSLAIAQLVKTKGWKIALFSIAVLSLTITALVIGSNLADNLSNRPSELSQFEGVSLGMSETELLIAKGEPLRIQPRDEESDIYIYGESASAEGESLGVFFRQRDNSKTVSDICVFDPFPQTNGIWFGMPEAQVRTTLGKPNAESIQSSRLAKIMTFDQLNTAIHITAGHVSGFCVTDREKFTFRLEH
jgi:hypothetical protein